jgi:hypothetical protein
MGIMDNNKFALDDFLSMDKNMVKKLNGIFQNYSISRLTDKKSFGVMDFIGYPLLLESSKYYNGELLLSFAYYKAMRECNKNLRSYAYCFENLIFRLISFWEYFYQFLNMYFDLKLYDVSSINKIVERVGYDVEFIEENERTKVCYVELDTKEQTQGSTE